MKFALHRDLVLPTTVGHTIEFKKGVLIHVPLEAHKEVIAVGAVPEHELPEAAVSNSREPKDPVEREKALMIAFEYIHTENRRDDFAGNGMPSANAILEHAGFRIEPKERDMLWTKFLQADKVVQDKVAEEAEAAMAAAADLQAEVAATAKADPKRAAKK